MFTKNEGNLDRIIRLFLGEILIIIGTFWVGGVVKVLLILIGVVSLITSITGFCALYKLLKISTVLKLQSKLSSLTKILTALVFIVTLFLGVYYSNFFTKKIFIEDFNRMNDFYKKTLFYTGQEKRTEAIDNYDKLVVEYSKFNDKYQYYQPYVISFDGNFKKDISKVSVVILGLKDKVEGGDLKSAHTDFEQIRPIFQDILKRNNFSLLTISLVDFHDAMEKIISTADAKDLTGTINIYEEVSSKLKLVEDTVNDSEIQTIRSKLDELKTLADFGKSDELSSKAAELKSSFVKVYMKRG